MFLFSWPEKTRIRQTSDAIDSAIGTKMHANRPSLPMVAVLWVGGCL